MPELLVRLKRPHEKQEILLNSPKKRIMCRAGRRSGKGQPLDARLWTRHGPILMGDVQVGTEIATPNGWTVVEDIYPLGVRDIYSFQFSGGGSTECTDDHLWQVSTNRKDSGRYRPDRVLETSELRSLSTVELQRLSVPHQGVVDFAPWPVPMDPYLLGVLLGDGGMSGWHNLRVSSADEEILDSVRAALPAGHNLRHIANYDYAISRGKYGMGRPGSLLDTLRLLGLYGRRSHEKFIPPSYLYNSREVRLALLQGLMDTDGWVDSRGQGHLEQTSAQLASDVCTLVESLGGFVRYGFKENDHKGVHRSYIILTDARDLFRLSRKKAKALPRAHSEARKIQSIEHSRRVEAQCIKVSAPDGLYLTDHMIATHNTTGLAGRAIRKFLDGARVLYATPTAQQLEQFWHEVRVALAEPINAKLLLSLIHI